MASTDTPIAIVGMACRFSGAANNPEKLWDLLSDGRSGWSEIPEERFATKGLLHPDGQKIGSVGPNLASVSWKVD
jgi:acyl transferase domain-containing protein